MRISVEIDEDTLREVMAMTGESSKGPAMTRALEEYVRRRKARDFGRLIREGAFDYPLGKAGDEELLNPIPPLAGP